MLNMAAQSNEALPFFCQHEERWRCPRSRIVNIKHVEYL